MDCSLVQEIKHNIDRERESMVFNCPLLDRQLCLWCCLHIAGCGNPSTRQNASEFNIDYYIKIPQKTQKTWDEMYSICSKCLARR